MPQGSAAKLFVMKFKPEGTDYAILSFLKNQMIVSGKTVIARELIPEQMIADFLQETTRVSKKRIASHLSELTYWKLISEIDIDGAKKYAMEARGLELLGNHISWLRRDREKAKQAAWPSKRELEKAARAAFEK